MIAWITGVMETLGYLGIAILMFAENLFPPIPSEAIMPLAGFTAASGGMTLVGAVLAGSAGSICGALAWFYVGRLLGLGRSERLAERHGRWLGINKGDIARSSAWFARHGRAAVLIGRMVPGIRTLISIPAGICGMPLLPFLVYSTMGTLIWTSLLAAAGYALGEHWRLVSDYLGPLGGLILLFLAVLLAAYLLRRRREAGKDRCGPPG